MKRLIYSNLLQWKDNLDRKPLVLLGARQVGKTYIINQFGEHEFDNMVYINCHNNPFANSLFRDFNIDRILYDIEQQYETKVLAGKFVPYETLAQDDNFLQKYIYQNEQIKEKIIQNYLDSLQTEKALPLISSHGSGTVSSPIKKPKTIKDAGQMVEAYFKNK